MHVVIVGAGLGGLTLALALGRCGVGSTVLEKAQVLEELGAGVQLSPNAVKCLLWLGLEESLASIASLPDAVEVRDHTSGRPLMTTPLGEAGRRRWGAPYMQVHRADLQNILLQAVDACGATKLQLGAELESIGEGGVTTLMGRRHAGDLIVGCDGVRSFVRRQTVGDGSARFTGEIAWRATVPAGRLSPSVSATATLVWTGARRHFVHYPIRRGGLVNLVAVTDGAISTPESWSEAGERAVLLEKFNGWPDAVTDLIAATTSVMCWALHDRAPLSRWSRGPITLLGDAAHPMSPFLAQGAGMAIEDAVTLARLLTLGGGVEPALARYERARSARTAKAQAWSRRNARLFHLPSLAAQGIFGAARTWDRARGAASSARLDWLYGYDATSAPI